MTPAVVWFELCWLASAAYERRRKALRAIGLCVRNAVRDAKAAMGIFRVAIIADILARSCGDRAASGLLGASSRESITADEDDGFRSSFFGKSNSREMPVKERNGEKCLDLPTQALSLK